jgi:hypothetical protein
MIELVDAAIGAAGAGVVAAGAAEQLSRTHVPHFRLDGSVSTDPLPQHPYPPPRRVVKVERWSIEPRHRGG